MILQKENVVALPQETQEQILAIRKELEQAQSNYESKLREVGDLMKELGLTSTKVENYTINIVAETTSKTFDSSRFKKEYNGLYETFLKETIRKEYIKMS